MAAMFENIKKGDTVLITDLVRVPGTHGRVYYRETTVERVYKNTFVVDGAKFYLQNGQREYTRDNRHDRREVRPLGDKWSAITPEAECTMGENITSLKLVMEVATKLEKRNNVKLSCNKAACDFIKAAMLEINKLLNENA